MGSGFSTYYTDPPRGRTNNRPSTTSRDRYQPPHHYPPRWRFNAYGSAAENDVTVEENPEVVPEEVKTVKPLKVKQLDYNIKENSVSHHTDEYDIVHEESVTVEGVKRPRQFVVRRGQNFTVTVKLDRPFNKEEDSLFISFEIGAQPRESKGTLVYINPLDENIKPGDWGAEIKEQTDDFLVISMHASPQCIVGIWNLVIETSLKHPADGKNDINRYLNSQPVYILMNPWCKEDKVYMEDELQRDECVLNDNGLLFIGGTYQIGTRPWNFGQFEGNILDCSMYLLDISRLNYQSRGDPVQISRSISAMVNEADNDSGVLIGNWSGDYSGGTRPTAWLGSVEILEQYFKTKKSVSFGQCWVFSGLVTTISRAIGLPCRSVTNFSSAHDTDGSITIDKHFDINGKAVRDLDSDSTWNFHVWNEAWMVRSDLPSDYSGWQAFDATPQETSGGIYRAGPASVKAIKEGNVNYLYDTPFIFAEVNADVVHWKQQEDGRFNKIIRIVKHTVGKNISTHRPRKNPRPETWFRNPMRMSVDQFREDLTYDYKFREFSEEERAAVYRANLHSTRAGEIYGDLTGGDDVKFRLKQKDGILVGNVFNVTLEMQNTSRETRTVFVELEISPVYYTGVPIGDSKPIKSQTFNLTIPAVKTKEAVMRVTADDYINKIVEQVTFEISAYAKVEETKQEYPTRELYRLRRPDLIITAPETAKVGEKIKVKVKLESPMPVHLTECEWNIEGAHLTMPIKVPQPDIDPYGHIEIEVEITPTKPGMREIMASFTSKELQDITFSVPITILE